LGSKAVISFLGLAEIERDFTPVNQHGGKSREFGELAAAEMGMAPAIRPFRARDDIGKLAHRLLDFLIKATKPAASSNSAEGTVRLWHSRRPRGVSA